MSKSTLFNTIRVRKPRSNVFDLSHEKKLSLDMGKLVPIYVQDVVPGDKFRVNSEVFLRFAPLIAPVMHRIDCYVHFFYVPYRILWDNFQNFITGGVDGKQVPEFPYITQIYDANNLSSYMAEGTLWDYMGLPVATDAVNPASVQNISALPFRAYYKIWYEFYRDQTLTVSGTEPSVGDSVGYPEAVKLLSLRNRCWEKDYFTSALPWTQRGDEVLIPSTLNRTEYSQITDADGAPLSGDLTAVAGEIGVNDGTFEGGIIDNSQNIEMTVNNLRLATRLQEWLEKNARAGARYTEQLLAHFGVRSSDARLQRPEYLGGGKQPVTISEVLNTSDTANAPQGNMAGHGVSVGNMNYFKKFFEEHGIVIGIMSVLPRTAYQQGIPKMFQKFDKLDFYWPEFAHLGEQEIKQKEIYHDWSDADPDIEAEETFGYTPRYAEYKYNPSTVHGNFKGDLSFWHMGRIWNPAEAPYLYPALNETFVTADPTNRIFAVTDPNVQHLYAQVYNNVKAIRPMPVFGTPRL